MDRPSVPAPEFAWPLDLRSKSRAIYNGMPGLRSNQRVSTKVRRCQDALTAILD